MVIISSQPFSMASFSVNDSQLPADVVISSGGMGQRFWVLMKRRAERSPATLGLATFRSEISPLRNAFVEMTGGGVISVSFMHFFTAPLCPGEGRREYFSHPFFYLSFIIYAGYSMNFMFHI